MTRNIYTPHNADRFYDTNNNEIKTDRAYADNYYDVVYPERSLQPDARQSYRAAEYRAPRYSQPAARYAQPDLRRCERPSKPVKKSHAGLITATVALTLAAVMAIGTLVFVAVKSAEKAADHSATTVATVSADKAAAEGAVVQQPVQEAAKTDSDSAPAATGTSQTAMSVAQNCYPGHSLEATAEENVVSVDGERVYMDVKRLAPAGAGSPAHFYANGKTSYGFDWNYKADNDNFVISCNYNFAKQQYDFTFYGKQAGVAHITVYYNTDDNTQVPVELTIKVDDHLNVSQG